MKGGLAHRLEMSKGYFHLFSLGSYLVTFLQGHTTTGFMPTSGRVFLEKARTIYGVRAPTGVSNFPFLFSIP